MTAKYELTKLYLANKEIKVTESSLNAFKADLRQTLEHIIIYHNQEVKVVCKPKKQGYDNYAVYPTPLQKGDSMPSF